MPNITCNFSKFPSHSKIHNGSEKLEFSVDELIHAAYTVGKQNWREVHSHPYYSMREIDFRISMVQAFLELNNDTVTRSSIFQKLDPSEKGAINYFFGNVFCKLIIQRKFQVKWLMHLDLFEGKIDVGDQKKRPDFVGRKNDSSWIAVESKSRQSKDKEVEKEALEQLAHLKMIDGSPPSIKLATILHGKVDEDLQLNIIDPEESKNYRLNIDKIKYDYSRDYYGIIYLVIKQKMEVKNIEGRKFATRTLSCHETVLGMDLYIYEILNRENGISYVTKEIEEYLQKYYKENELSETDDYYVGSDGLYVRYFGEIKSKIE